ncbi:hypothetical protein [Microbacterium testaceum]|uniref:Uncharacterized protein n=1 Tax=Microbacterium testaceum TaxID=2033 RepID=A0A2T7W9U4_MICTE|nr:hypothetical protein [Microbacterium testaceum]PVE67919.1 hypothetical protein DC432_12225 [Microbacterium testaceum]
MNTVGHYKDFFAAAAQVIPVLALALVLEARLIANRYSKKNAFGQRGLRVAWGLFLGLLAFLIVQALVSSLNALTKDQQATMSGWDWYAYLVTWTAIYLGSAAVVTIPITAIVISAVADVIGYLLLRVPWGPAQKLRREIIVEIRQTEQDVNDARDTQRDFVVVASKFLVVGFSGKRSAESALRDYVRTSPWMTESERRDHVSYFEKNIKTFEEAILDGEKAWKRHKKAKKLARRLETAIQRQKSILSKVDEIVTNGGSPAQIERQRRQLAQASRH